MAKKQTTPNPDPHKTITRKVTKALPCKLTEPEILQYGRDMAHAMSERERVQAELDSVKQEYKARLEEYSATINKLSGRVNSGIETRDVACLEVKDWTDATVRITRLDTSEDVEARPMREDEKQMELTDVPAAGAAGDGE
jgi:hypothetical protein